MGLDSVSHERWLVICVSRASLSHANAVTGTDKQGSVGEHGHVEAVPWRNNRRNNEQQQQPAKSLAVRVHERERERKSRRRPVHSFIEFSSSIEREKRREIEKRERKKDIHKQQAP